MNRFKVITTLVVAAQAAIGFVLAAGVVLPPPWALLLGAANVALAVVATQMPSWRESGRADRAVSRALGSDSGGLRTGGS